MDLGGQAERMKFMIRDRGPSFTAAFDAVLADAGIRTVLCNVRTPRMNAITERWIGGFRRELLDRTRIWNQAHLRQILRTYENHHNQHRPHRSLHAAAPLKPLPGPVDLEQYRVRRQGSLPAMRHQWSPDSSIKVRELGSEIIDPPQPTQNDTTPLSMAITGQLWLPTTTRTPTSEPMTAKCG